PFPDGRLPADSVHCLASGFVIEHPNTPAVNYLWEDGSSAPERIVEETSTYLLTSFNACDTITDTFNVQFNKPPAPILASNDSTICSGTPINIAVVNIGTGSY